MSWFSEGKFRLNIKEDVKPVAFTARFSDKSILEAFDEIAKKSKYTRNELLNIVVEKFVNEVEIVESDNQEDELLIENFSQLIELLKRHINKEIKIPLNGEEHGNGCENEYYRLIDYSFFMNERKLILEFKGQDETEFNKIHTLTIDNIIDISCRENNLVFRIWLYTPNGNWKFYLK